jgi:folate-binding Fe-S cluster repair protein YgfZ
MDHERQSVRKTCKGRTTRIFLVVCREDAFLLQQDKEDMHETIVVLCEFGSSDGMQQSD